MKREDREVILIAGIIIIISSISLIAVLYFFWQLVGPPLGKLIDTVQYGLTVNQSNYNFAYPGLSQTTAIRSEYKGSKPNNYSRNMRRLKQVLAFLERPDYSFDYPDSENTLSSPRVRLSGRTDELFSPSIRQEFNNRSTTYESGLKVVIGDRITGDLIAGYDYAEIMKRGFWIVPGSLPVSEGGVIITCYRRYLLPLYPQSCWDIDLIKVGDEIIIYKGEDIRQKYVVSNIENANTTNSSIYSANTGNTLKIITSDPIGSQTQLIVITAIPK